MQRFLMLRHMCAMKAPSSYAIGDATFACFEEKYCDTRHVVPLPVISRKCLYNLKNNHLDILACKDDVRREGFSSQKQRASYRSCLW